MAQTSSWIKQSYSMSVNDLITKRREYEIEQDLVGNGSYNQRLAAFIAKRDAAVAAEEVRLAARRAKLKAAEERKRAKQAEAICESKSMPDAVSFADSIDNLALSS